MRARLLVFMLAVAVWAPVAPARALPLGPPTISIDISSTDDPFTFDITANASDPDGVVDITEICVDDGSGDCVASRARNKFPGADRALACVTGDSGVASLTHTFPTWGEYAVRARATAGGCPFIGADESASAYETITITPPDLTSIEISCSTEGEPAATDIGVSADAVKLASTVQESGPGASFLAAASHAMRAVVAAVNKGGGVCGRMIDLRLENDDGDPERGQQFVRDSARDSFALAVMPSMNTLSAALDSGVIDAAGIPVVGTLGRDHQEFAHDLVWPVGSTPETFAWLSVGHAYDAGARCFGIVYERGVSEYEDTAAALRAAIASHPGARVCSDVGILPSSASYAAEIQRFNLGCDEGGGCDAVLLALDPQTAQTWIAGRPRRGSIETSTVRALFNEQFATGCGAPCNGFLSWTDMQPPIGEFASATKDYVSVMKSYNPAEDTTNRFAESAYLGMFMLLTQMGRTGVDLTRVAFENTLDSSPLASDLVGNDLDYSARRDANHSMRAYGIAVAQGSFAGWRRETDWLSAP